MQLLIIVKGINKLNDIIHYAYLIFKYFLNLVKYIDDENQEIKINVYIILFHSARFCESFI